jgi:hypothetical protein
MAHHFETLLTPFQAAAILQVKPNTLAKWRVAGEGPAFIHVGRAVRYSAREAPDAPLDIGDVSVKCWPWIENNDPSSSITIQCRIL